MVWGQEPPCKPQPSSQEAACSRLMAVTQRRRSPAPCRPTLRAAPAAEVVKRQASQHHITTGYSTAEPCMNAGLTHPHAPDTPAPTRARQAPPARAGPPRRARVGAGGGRVGKHE